MTETRFTKEVISWEPLPEDYILPKDPVDNLEHPILAAELTALLDAADLLTESCIVATYFGICARVDGEIFLKDPDWVYIPYAKPMPKGNVRKSYTPHSEGDVPSVVMEFLCDVDNGEDDASPNGKWWFYEKILQVPRYAIFEPSSGRLEVYQLKGGKYSPQIPDAEERFWIPGVNLFLGVWYGTKQQRTGHWLRWWDEGGNMLLSATEKLPQEQQRAADAEKRAADAKQEATDAKEENERLKARLRELGIDPDELS